jgi:hypothetical protein
VESCSSQAQLLFVIDFPSSSSDSSPPTELHLTISMAGGSHNFDGAHPHSVVLHLPSLWLGLFMDEFGAPPPHRWKKYTEEKK